MVSVDLDEPLLTAAELAERLRVPRSSIYEYRRRLNDPLPAVEVGRHIRFHVPAVELWLARQATAAPMRVPA